MAYLLPLASSLLYVLAVLFLKQANDRGVGLWRTTVVTNLLVALLFSGLTVLGGQVHPALWYQPALVGLIFLVGQILGFLAIQRGDVSVATPVMGIKVVLVALGVTLLLGERVPAALWAAALLSSAGLLFLNRGDPSPRAGRAGPAIGFGILAAAAFALFDVLTQKWSPAWGAGRFLPLMMGCVALYTVLYVAIFRVPLGHVSREARRPLFLGGLFMAVQAVSLIAAIAVFRKATTINVVYSARGLWSVLAVWVVGHWFANRERDQGSSVFRARLIGAGLLLAAVTLAVLAR
ncbi:MAG TPA: EamA/RhaT family transporter [Planctomycetota bacterium]